uniref:Na(+)/H(+) antiporter 2 n=5 Tax=Zygosaccharomyces TaxID=4953 RepID=NAH2_ZYGRO|nr:RecName: Full=Na(+)/H(+) antiporter 2 [Zygosaccharomyces rouxii]BAA24268.1 Zsod22p [Zygosaccharomyces rouxii]
MAWSQLEVTKAHVAYSCVGIFSSIFSLVSLFVKEQLYIGESMVASIFGLIVGPHCLNWFNPLSWGNTDSITLEISRILLCLQVFAVSVELPRKYMLKHWVSVTMLLVPVMTSGWLVIALFVWILVPGLNFPASLLMGACITATDPVLAQSVVSGTFAQKVPGHLRNLLSCESGCNDGLAIPFVFLSLDLLLYPGRGGQIVKDWICVTILWECIFGSILGCIIGYCGRKAIRFAEGRHIIDRESFLAFYLILALTCAGFGSMLGVDDLLVSFFAGTAFAWDGWFAAKTHESNVSNVIDVLLNYAYFVYLGSILPWKDFNNPDIGLDVWRLILLSLVVIFLRRIPAVLSLKPLIPDIKSWREAMFIGHFGPIGVGAVFAAITSKSQLESHLTNEETPLKDTPGRGSKHWQVMACIWPITCFSIMTSVIVHGSSVAVIMLGRYLSTVTLMALPTGRTTNTKNAWLERLPALDKSGRPFSLQRLDKEPSLSPGQIGGRTSGMVATPKLGMRQRWRQKLQDNKEIEPDIEMNNFCQGTFQIRKETHASTNDSHGTTTANLGTSNGRAQGLPWRSKMNIIDRAEAVNTIYGLDKLAEDTENKDVWRVNTSRIPGIRSPYDDVYTYQSDSSSIGSIERQRIKSLREQEQQAYIAYTEDDQVIIENRQGEILEYVKFHKEGLGDAESGLHNHDRPKRAISPPLEKLHQITNEARKNKYYAYKVGNDLVIEDESGEVFRRYRISPHGGKRKIKKIINPVSSVLSSVGITKPRGVSERINHYLLHSEDEMADDEAESENDMDYEDSDGPASRFKDHAD